MLFHDADDGQKIVLEESVHAGKHTKRKIYKDIIIIVSFSEVVVFGVYFL